MRLSFSIYEAVYSRITNDIRLKKNRAPDHIPKRDTINLFKGDLKYGNVP
jgi:hypothetical protein